MICFEGATARIYAWSNWSEVASVDLNIGLMGLQMKNVIPYVSGNGQRILVELSELDGSANACGLYLLDAASFAIETKSSHEAYLKTANVGGEADMVSKIKEGIQTGAISMPLLRKKLATLSHHVAHIVGLSAASRIVFLDTHSWICSVDLDGPEDSPALYLRHFFVPYDWFSGTRNVVSSVTQRDVLIARNADVAIIRAGLEYAQAVSVRAGVSETKIGTKGLFDPGDRAEDISR
jgi:hypothetical protein